MKHFYILALSGLILNGCANAPDFTRPYLDFLNGTTYENREQVQDIDTHPMSQWWIGINDPQLNQNIDKMMVQNLSLRQGGERIIQVQEGVTSIHGNYYPTLGINGQYGRSFASSAITDERAYTNSYVANLTSSWQMDLFGKLKNQETRVDSILNATIYEQEALTQSLIAQMVETHIAIATAQELVSLAQRNVNNRQQILNLAKGRYNLGAANTTTGDIYNAQGALTSAQGDLRDFERVLTQYGYALDIMLGQKPGTTDVSQKINIIPPSGEVATCLPADLLDRRPDLKSSQLRLIAAHADVDIAIDALYPSISLASTLGFSGNDDSQFFTAEKLAGSLLGTITSTLFQGGKLRSNIRLEESEAREMSLAYSEKILNAVGEVETALMTEKNLKDQIAYQEKTVHALLQSEKFAKNRYENGLQTMKNYLDIQQNKYLAEQGLYQLYQSHWNNRIALYLALGGDWFNDEKTKTCAQGVKS